MVQTHTKSLPLARHWVPVVSTSGSNTLNAFQMLGCCTSPRTGQSSWSSAPLTRWTRRPLSGGYGEGGGSRKPLEPPLSLQNKNKKSPHPFPFHRVIAAPSSLWISNETLRGERGCGYETHPGSILIKGVLINSMTKSRAAVQLKSGGECCWFQLVSVVRILVVGLRYLVPAATSFTAAAFLSSVTTGWVSWKYILSRWTPVYLSRRALYATALVSLHLAGKRNDCAAAPVERAGFRRHPANMFLSSATSIWERLHLFLIAHFVSHLSHIWLHGCRAEIVRHPFVKKNSYQQLKTCFY